MRLFATLALTTAFATAPAIAQSMTLQFVTDTGSKTVYEVTEDNKLVSTDGLVFDVSFSEDGKKMCTAIPDFGDICTDFDAKLEKVGDSANYETPDLGSTGTVTVVKGS